MRENDLSLRYSPVRWMKRGVLTFAGTLLVLHAGAQVSLTTAVDLAVKNDPRVHSAQAELEHAKASLAEARDAYVPSATVTGGYGQSTGVPLSVPVVFSFGSQSLLFNFSQRDYIRAAEMGVHSAELALREAHDQVAEDVTVSYLDLAHAQRRREAVADESGYANKLVMIVQQRLDAGEDTRIDLVKAKRTAAQIRLVQLQADDEVVNLSDHLARMMGLQGNPVEVIPTSIPEMPRVETLTAGSAASFGVQAAFSTAQSKQEMAFGDSRWRLRPQASFFMNYSYIDTGPSDYVQYYPGFISKSRNAASIGIQVQFPLFDNIRGDKARESAADALKSRADAEHQRNQFLEGRAKLQHSLAELSAQNEIAQDDQEIAQDQIDQVLVQLQADSASTGGPQMTPKDEQNARLQERMKYVDLLNAQFQMQQAEINLLRQTGQFDAWLKTAAATPDTVTGAPVKP